MEGRVYVEMDGCKSGCFLSKSQKEAGKALECTYTVFLAIFGIVLAQFLPHIISISLHLTFLHISVFMCFAATTPLLYKAWLYFAAPAMCRLNGRAAL